MDVAGESSIFLGIRYDRAVGAGTPWWCSMSPHPSPVSGVTCGVHGAGRGGGRGGMRVSARGVCVHGFWQEVIEVT